MPKQDKVITNQLYPNIQLELCNSFYFGNTKKKMHAAQNIKIDLREDGKFLEQQSIP